MVFQMLTLQQTKISIPPEPVFQNMRQEMSGPIAQMDGAFGMNPKIAGSTPQSGRGIFCLKNSWRFKC